MMFLMVIAVEVRLMAWAHHIDGVKDGEHYLVIYLVKIVTMVVVER